jgi:5-methyltetrahydrofolate--homocysteine methyltransferase
VLNRRRGFRDSPLLVGSIFYPKDKLVLNRETGEFKRAEAEAVIGEYVELCTNYGVKCTIDVEGETVEAFQKFLDFVAGIVPRDWAIMADATAKDLRLGVAYWAWQVGLSNRLIINSIDYKSPVDELIHYRDFGVAGLVAAAFDVNPGNKIKVAESIMGKLREAGLFNSSILIDLSVLDVPDMAATAALIPEFKARIPSNFLVGFAPANVVPTWKKVDAVLKALREKGINDEYMQLVKPTMRASMAVTAAMFPYIDFILFGPLREALLDTTVVASILSGDFKIIEWRDEAVEESKPVSSPKSPRPFSGMITDLKAALDEAEARIDETKINTREAQGLDELKTRFSAAVGDLEDGAVDLAKQLLDMGVSPLELIELMKKGMDVVGERYEKGEYFVSELVMAGEIGEGVVKLIEPFFKENRSADRVKVIIGTVEGDIHSIGKNIVKMMLMANGYDVIDLGVDVPAERFVEEAERNGAQVIGLSSLLSTSAINMRKVLELLDKRGLRGRIRVIIGGAAVTEEYAKKINADGYAKNAVETVRLLDKWFKTA